MGEIINLRRVRKAKARTASEAQAAANRAFYGRTKTAKQSVRLEKERHERLLDGAKIEQD